MSKTTSEEIARIQSLRRNGASIREIARATNRCTNTVSKYLNSPQPQRTQNKVPSFHQEHFARYPYPVRIAEPRTHVRVAEPRSRPVLEHIYEPPVQDKQKEPHVDDKQMMDFFRVSGRTGIRCGKSKAEIEREAQIKYLKEKEERDKLDEASKKRIATTQHIMDLNARRKAKFETYLDELGNKGKLSKQEASNIIHNEFEKHKGDSKESIRRKCDGLAAIGKMNLDYIVERRKKDINMKFLSDTLPSALSFANDCIRAYSLVKSKPKKPLKAIVIK